MLLLKLVNDTVTGATYAYYPEGKDEQGVLLVKKDSGDVDVLTLAPNDEQRRYLAHAVKKIAEFHKNGVYEEQVTVAWY